VKLLGWFENPETLYIAMEYLPEGDLTKHLDSPLRQETVQTISKQAIEGLKVMHQKGMAHRDLKPAVRFPELKISLDYILSEKYSQMRRTSL